MAVPRSALAVTINWNGRRMQAIPLQPSGPKGSWLMEALEPGERWGVGDTIEVQADEIEGLPVAVITEGIAVVQPRVLTSSVPQPKPRTRPMADSSLKDRLARAAVAGAELTQIIGDRADRLIERKDALLDRADRAFYQHENVMDAAEQGVDLVDHALDIMAGNGGPGSPLAGSTGSSSTS